ncbi:Aspartic proteinase CDR1 [Capsicum annuum]|uniref:aspartic proteinase CDR1-like n=1 Tax=Capsicum annuum TaxID=4072 RepID=UPI001FB12466|nr:aspartic proteinase CDR1-like [Capsicum annuum]KAF3680799.1 Aspartic proteinase CDR1 [Capsicum annuum]KAF3684784.1 Aspartic proteinase CDR1 [Capsicum annuum]
MPTLISTIVMKTNTKARTLFPTTFVFLFFLHLSFVCCRKIISSNRGEIGFTLDLIHRDSPQSPFYNPSNSVRDAFHRSFSRASFFQKSSFASPDSIQSSISPIPGEYLMKLSIGTPPVEIVAIADTGSDLTWTQCQPCINCFQQSYPLFDSKKSSTYKTIGCDAQECTSIGSSSSCVSGNNVCEYQINYGDNSHTIGDLAFDVFTFHSTSSENVAIPNVAFGCGHDNGGTFNNHTSGIIGLGGGEVSIIKQLDKQINGKFSYCLIPIQLDSTSISNVTSHINFGSNAIVSGPDVVSTPLIRMESSTFYYLTLEGVSVGNKTLEFKSSKIGGSYAGGDEGNIIIDSGTTLTLMPSEFYENLESMLVDSINATRKEDSSGTFGLCYDSDENGTIDAPTIVAHFTNADLELSPSSTFAQVEKGLVCLTIVPAKEFAIFGNLAQANFLIGYDLVANKISFKPTDCTNY